MIEKAKWCASLSNGMTIKQGDKGFEDDQKSSGWVKLDNYLVKNNSVAITSLQVIKDSHIWNLPTGKNRFGGEAPIDYGYFRRAVSRMLNGTKDRGLYICIYAVYQGFIVRLFVDEQTNVSWIDVKVGQ